MAMSKRTLCFPNINIIGKVLNAWLQFKFTFSVYSLTQITRVLKRTVSVTTHLGAQNQVYKQVDSDLFKYHDVFLNAHLKYRLLLQCRQLSSITAVKTVGHRNHRRHLR